jgi:DNA polymerase-1
MYFALTAGGSGQRWLTSAGEPTAGTYGFARELLRILELEKPDYLAVAFDTGKTFRDALFPEYKATRAKMPDDLRTQIDRIRTIVDAFNMPRLEVEGYEADDVLGTVARQVAEKGLGVRIITGDRDLLQLVNERTAVYLAGDDQNYITDDQVMGKLGVLPKQVVDYKAIVGDKSDNIPGVPGVGEKTAVALLEKYGTLDAIYEHMAEIEPRWQKKLLDGRDSAYMSYDLARIRTDIPVTIDLDQARADHYDPEAVIAIFKELEFRSLISKLQTLKSPGSAAAPSRPAPAGQMSLFAEAPAAPVIKPVASATSTRVVDTPEALAALAAELRGAKTIAFDTETTSTEEMLAEIVGISLAVREGEGVYIPVGHRGGRNLPLNDVLDAIRGPMTDPAIAKVAHHAKYDYIVLARSGLRVTPLSFDTMIAEWLLDPSSRTLGLKPLAYARLGMEMTHIDELIGTGKKQISMAEVPVESAAPYAAADADATLQLMSPQRAELAKGNGLKLLEEIEMPLVPVLADMEMTGILLDLPFFKEMEKELAGRLAQIESQVYQEVGSPFNINSTQQLSDVLFKTLRLDPPDRGKKTASGHYSTSADVLEYLRGKHPVVDMVLEHRELSKLKSTYIDSLPLTVHPQTGRVHTSYSQTGAVTGRLSSSNPNLQNIPIRTEEGRRVRNGFIAAPGHVLVSVDYSQIELRIVAHMAGDEAMLGAFRQGQDIHATTAAAIYGVPLDAVTKEQRRHAKAINFGLIYGMSAFGLTRTTDLTLAEAEDFVKAYFRQFPGVKRYLDGIRKQATQDGYVETLLGRRRYFPALRGQMNQNLRNREEREAINAPIQGTAADIMKIAMLHIPPALKKAGLSGRMLLQVHDEIVVECPREELEPIVRTLQSVMEAAYSLSIPLSTEARWGRSWGAMQVVEAE